MASETHSAKDSSEDHPTALPSQGRSNVTNTNGEVRKSLEQLSAHINITVGQTT